MSNSQWPRHLELVHVEEDPEGTEIECKRCHGSGNDPRFEEDTDCQWCEGFGSIMVY